MTDYKSTIAELRYLAEWAQHHLDKAKIANDAADAIEALQADVEQVKGFWKEAQLRNRNLLEEGNDLAMLADQYKAERDALQSAIEALQGECAEHKENAIRNARQAVAFRAERDALQAENERLKTENDNFSYSIIAAANRKLREENNALQAKLDELGEQEPVAFMCSDNDLIHRGYQKFSATKGGAWDIPVYAAPKALQAENERLKVDGACWKHLHDETAAERDQLQAENERLKAGYLKIRVALGLDLHSTDNLLDVAQALKAKLDELQRQEPVVKVVATMNGIFPTWFNGDWHRQNYRPTDLREDKQISLYAAPKALEPLTDKQAEAAWRAGWEACRDAEYIGQEAEDDAWGMSETCVKADWESAAPKALEPLTDEQLHAVMEGVNFTYNPTLFARAIEAAHGITKGTP